MQCAICLENCKGGRCLPCNHTFHHTCISKWEKKQTSCPCCRAHIPVTCGFCSKTIEADSFDIVKLTKCGCKHHFSCWQKEVQKKTANNIKCVCGKKNNFWKVEGKDYGELPKSYQVYCGERELCTERGCFRLGNPRRNGKCIRCEPNVLIGGFATKKAMEFMARFGTRLSEPKNTLLTCIGMKIQSTLNLNDNDYEIVNDNFLRDLYNDIKSESLLAVQS